jgi:hypothetical protein
MPTIPRKDKILQMGLKDKKFYYSRRIIFTAVILDIDMMEFAHTCAGSHNKNFPTNLCL